MLLKRKFMNENSLLLWINHSILQTLSSFFFLQLFYIDILIDQNIFNIVSIH